MAFANQTSSEDNCASDRFEDKECFENNLETFRVESVPNARTDSAFDNTPTITDEEIDAGTVAKCQADFTHDFQNDLMNEIMSHLISKNSNFVKEAENKEISDSQYQCRSRLTSLFQRSDEFRQSIHASGVNVKVSDGTKKSRNNFDVPQSSSEFRQSMPMLEVGSKASVEAKENNLVCQRHYQSSDCLDSLLLSSDESRQSACVLEMDCKSKVGDSVNVSVAQCQDDLPDFAVVKRVESVPNARTDSAFDNTPTITDEEIDAGTVAKCQADFTHDFQNDLMNEIISHLISKNTDFVEEMIYNDEAENKEISDPQYQCRRRLASLFKRSDEFRQSIHASGVDVKLSDGAKKTRNNFDVLQSSSEFRQSMPVLEVGSKASVEAKENNLVCQRHYQSSNCLDSLLLSSGESRQSACVLEMDCKSKVGDSVNVSVAQCQDDLPDFAVVKRVESVPNARTDSAFDNTPTITDEEIDAGTVAKCQADFTHDFKNDLMSEITSHLISKNSDSVKEMIYNDENKEISDSQYQCRSHSVLLYQRSNEFGRSIHASGVDDKSSDGDKKSRNSFDVLQSSSEFRQSMPMLEVGSKASVEAKENNLVCQRHYQSSNCLDSLLLSSDESRQSVCVLEMDCKSKVGASVNVSVDQCQDDLPDFAVVNGANEEVYTKLLETLTKTEYELEKQAERYNLNCTRKDFLYKKAMDSFMKEREKVIQMFDDLERHAFDLVENNDKRNQERLDSVMARREALRDRLEYLKSNLEEMKRTGDKVKLSASLRETERKIAACQKELKRIDANNSICYYEFVASEEILFALNSTKSLGRLKFWNMKAVFIAKVDVKQTKYRTCEIKDMCVLPSKKLAIIDKTNRALKIIVPEKNKVLSVVVMGTEPSGVTKTDNSKLAVSLPDENQIQFFSISKSCAITKSDQVKVHHKYSGIAYSRGDLIVSCLTEKEIHVLNMNGTLRKIYTADFFGHKQFTTSSLYTLCPAMSPNGDTIYVLDNVMYLTSMSLDGKLKALYNDEDLRNPRGLAVDNEGNIYVSGYKSNNIHVLTKDLVRIQILLNSDDGITCPESLAFFDNKLYIGMKDIIKVFEIRY